MGKMFYIVGAVVVVAIVVFAAIRLSEEPEIVSSIQNAGRSIEPSPAPAASETPASPPLNEESQVASAPPSSEAVAEVRDRLDGMLADRLLGSADAPVTMIEYSSLACPHCADFHKNTLPGIKEAYIDTGKVRLIYRDYPIGAVALAAAMVARCVGERKYFGMIDILFRNQEKWAGSKTPLVEIERIARFAGLSREDVGACLNDRALMEGIQQRAKDANQRYGVDSTPSFIIEGKLVIGALPLEHFREVLDEALAKKN